MSRLIHNTHKFRYEGRTKDGRTFAVDEDAVAQRQLDAWKDTGSSFVPGLLDSHAWEGAIGKTVGVYLTDLLLEQITEAEQTQRRKERQQQEAEAKREKRAEIRDYLLAHPNLSDDRSIASHLGTTHFQVRRVRREMAQE